jgi:hypothetical protein
VSNLVAHQAWHNNLDNLIRRHRYNNTTDDPPTHSTWDDGQYPRQAPHGHAASGVPVDVGLRPRPTPTGPRDSPWSRTLSDRYELAAVYPGRIR